MCVTGSRCCVTGSLKKSDSCAGFPGLCAGPAWARPRIKAQDPGPGSRPLQRPHLGAGLCRQHWLCREVPFGRDNLLQGSEDEEKRARNSPRNTKIGREQGWRALKQCSQGLSRDCPSAHKDSTVVQCLWQIMMERLILKGCGLWE